MILRIDMASQVPIYVQLRNEIVRGIARGEFAVGRACPPSANWRRTWG